MTKTILYKYFLACKSHQEVKDQYKILAKKLHPDTGGSHSEFVNMKEEYDYIINNPSTVFPIINIHNKPIDWKIKQYPKVTHIDADELEKQYAIAHFNKERNKIENHFSLIDILISRGSVDSITELNRLTDATLEDFKYMLWKLNKPVRMGTQLYKMYLHNKAGW